MENLLPVTSNRREFLRKGLIITAVSGAGMNLINGCSPEKEENISPPEDLMREHGVLDRIMLIYDTFVLHLRNRSSVSVAELKNSSGLIRSFIENYHEKLEENYLFPRFIKAGKHVELVHTLKDQHIAGRIITERLAGFSTVTVEPDTGDSERLITLLNGFTRMYRSHKSREDTVLFPAIRGIMPAAEFSELGEKFEDEENTLFGKNGFESVVEKVAAIEKNLGIYDLVQFTPVLE